MRILLCVSLIVVMTFSAGCSTSDRAIDQGGYGGGYESSMDGPVIEGSLFAEDQAAISNEAITAILSSKVRLPSENRVAVLRAVSPRSRYWSEDMVRLDQKITDDFINRLKTSKRVTEAFFVPSILAPKSMTVSQMRAAAARTQAGLLVVYRPTTETFAKYRFMGKDETKAYSTVEAALMDVRTGIIPFTSMATETEAAAKASKDFDFYETILNAQQQATRKALEKVGADIVAFLDSEE